MANNSEVKYLSMPSPDLRTALLKRKPVLMIAAGFALLGALIPIAVAADDPTATQAAGVAADTVWVIVTGCLVMFMQAGFAMLEVGFSRMKNVGTVVAKVVTNLSVSSIAYWAVVFGIPFAAFIYPLISHQLFGGGYLQATLGAQDFAGSTVVHLTGATAGLAGLLLLGPRIGKYEKGRSNAIPGHNMPLAQLGVLILWFGWFGFNPGSTLNATNLHFADIVVVTNLAAAAGAVAALATIYFITKTMDVGMIGNGAIAALVAITAPSGYVEPWAAIVIGAVAGVIVVLGVLALDKILDDPVGALPAHGMAGIWGTLSCGLFTVPALAKFNGVGQGGFFYTG